MTVAHQWETTGRVTPDGKRLFRCQACGRPTLVAEDKEPPAGLCAPARPAELTPTCKHRGGIIAQHGCCGSPIAHMFACEAFGACTIEANDGTLEWAGKSVASCAGCERRATANQE